MSARDCLCLTAGLWETPLAGGEALRLLTIQEMLEARREALTLKGERALCSNACLVARALVRNGTPVYASGETVLEALPPEQIQHLAAQWAAFHREENPGLGTDRERVEQIKEQLARMPQERLRWKVLRAFRALPTEERAKALTGRDLLWCALNLLLDQEEETELLCPACRAEAEKERCPVCGCETGARIWEENTSFDMDWFLRLKRGEEKA